MATQAELQKIAANMLKGIRETDVWTTSAEPRGIQALYNIDDLISDESPDFLALAIVNHLRRNAGEIKQSTKDTSIKGALEELAADALDAVFEGVGDDPQKAHAASFWINNYLQGVLTYRSKLIADAQSA